MQGMFLVLHRYSRVSPHHCQRTHRTADHTYFARSFLFALGLRSDARLASLLCSSPDYSLALFGILVRGAMAVEQVT